MTGHPVCGYEIKIPPVGWCSSYSIEWHKRLFSWHGDKKWQSLERKLLALLGWWPLAFSHSHAPLQSYLAKYVFWRYLDASHSILQQENIVLLSCNIELWFCVLWLSCRDAHGSQLLRPAHCSDEQEFCLIDRSNPIFFPCSFHLFPSACSGMLFSIFLSYLYVNNKAKGILGSPWLPEDWLLLLLERMLGWEK